MGSPERAPEAPESTPICNQELWGELSVFLQGRWPDVRNLSLPYRCSLQRVADKLRQGTCSVRSCPNLLLGLAHCSCFCPSQCPMMNLYSCPITRQQTFVSLSQTCSVDKAFFYGAVVQAS